MEKLVNVFKNGINYTNWKAGERNKRGEAKRKSNRIRWTGLL